MENLNIKAGKSSPSVWFDCQNHLLEIRGESFPENTAEFYAPVLSWIEEYLQSKPNQPVTVNLEIIYANSSSTKVLMDMLSLFDEAAGQGVPITVNWRYDPENENALESGEAFQEILESLKFNLVEIT